MSPYLPAWPSLPQVKKKIFPTAPCRHNQYQEQHLSVCVSSCPEKAPYLLPANHRFIFLSACRHRKETCLIMPCGGKTWHQDMSCYLSICVAILWTGAGYFSCMLCQGMAAAHTATTFHFMCRHETFTIPSLCCSICMSTCSSLPFCLDGKNVDGFARRACWQGGMAKQLYLQYKSRQTRVVLLARRPLSY